MSERDIACVILGAGLGTRFGGPKALAELAPGVRFIDAVANAAVQAGANPVVAVLPPGVVGPPDVRSVVNANGAGEQISSVRLGLTQLANSTAMGALLWPVDHPRVSPATVRALIVAARELDAPVIVPTHDGQRGHPGYFSRDTWRELLTVEDGGARAVIHRYGTQVREVPVPDRGMLIDVDYPEDLLEVRPDGLG